MTIAADYPYEVRSVEATWIELSDGARLSARLRLPDAGRPVPAVLEYLPYRKNDGTLARDNIQHDYLAGHGLACVRVDIRGSGDSDGALQGEYLATELDDGVEVIDWIARQPWCNGNVGMMGISWGGFNSLQVAAKRPAALGAIVSVAATADRYATDVHYKGGCVLAGDMLPWSTTMSCFNARPPTRRVVGDGWRRQWLERLNATPFLVHDWLAHQQRDDFWKHGSVCEDYGDIDCPVLIVGGLADGYTDTVFHIAEGLASTGHDQWRGIVGPWSHNYPATGVPGPNIGFLQEVLNWFCLHLDPERTVVVPAADGAKWSDPMRIWLQDWVPPASFYSKRPGQWISEPSWPSPHVADQEWWLHPATKEDGGAGGPDQGAADGSGHQNGSLHNGVPHNTALGNTALGETAPADTSISGTNTQTCGLRQGGWWGYAQPGQLPADQRLEEPAAFRFLGTPVHLPVSIVGIPRVRLTVSADTEQALVAVRLCDVAPDGSSLQLSRGVLNLCHRNSHEFLEAVVPGQPMAVEVVMDGMAHTLPAGHRLELHIGTALWPLVWPSPRPVTLNLHLGEGSVLLLPVRDPAATTDTADAEVSPFGDPETADPQSHNISPPVQARTINEDTGSGMVTVVDHYESGAVEFVENNDVMASTATDTWIISRHDPLSARVICHRTWSVTWSDHAPAASVLSIAEMWCDAQWFYTTNTVTVNEGDNKLFGDTQEHRYPRNHV